MEKVVLVAGSLEFDPRGQWSPKGESASLDLASG